MKNLISIILFVFLSINLFSQRSILELNNGKKVTVRIYDEDSTNYYFKMLSNWERIESYISKDSVRTVKVKEESDIPIDVSFGFGSSHGCIGTKVLLGKDNSGAFVGIGGAPHGLVSPSFGVQVAFKPLFGNFGYGSRGVYKLGDDPYKLDMDLFYNIGLLFKFGEYNQFFVEIAFGGLGMNKNFDPGYTNFEYFHYNGTIAVGFDL